MAFQAVANSGSITKAAQLLHVSQPSISKHIKNLEGDCGAKLFERNAGAAELTDAGSSLLRHVNSILVHLDEATKELKSPKNWTKSDPLKVARSYAASALLLPSLLVNFKSKHREEEKANRIRPSSSHARYYRDGKRSRQDG